MVFRLEAEFSNYDGKFRLPLVLTVGRPIFHSNCEGEMEVARVTVGQNRPHLGLCLGHNVPLQGRQGSRGCIPNSPGESGLVSREAKDSALLSSRTGYFLDPTEWPKGSQSSCEVWREDQGLLSRSGRKRRPPSLLDGGILWFFSNCGATVGFLTRYDGVLREPLVWY